MSNKEFTYEAFTQINEVARKIWDLEPNLLLVSKGLLNAKTFWKDSRFSGDIKPLTKLDGIVFGSCQDLPIAMLYYYDVDFERELDINKADIYWTKKPLMVYDFLTKCWQPDTPAGRDVK